ncbi:MAG: hypothetical protein R2873_15885 [Caldilineaceae bacterium]
MKRLVLVPLLLALSLFLAACPAAETPAPPLPKRLPPNRLKHR